ncbi:MAG: type II secretion system F family protein [Verrucomicrobia bacterium]|nr:type II secretion system F family protein [Verrucomicrobiota bacterium]
MTRFQYTAVTEGGERVTGFLEAETEGAVLRLLEEKRLFPVTVAGTAGAADASTRARLRVRSRDVGIMYGQLADLIGSGVPMLRALDSMVKSTVNPKLKAVLKEVRVAVADGKTFTDALRQFPEVFPLLHTAMVQAGERAAFLEQVLRSLSHFIERLDELRSRVVGALIYPALLTVLGTAVMIGALLFFVPRFEPLLAGAKKPLPTEILFGASKVLRHYWFVLPLVLAGAGGALWSAMQNETNRLRLERWRLRLPVVGTALRMVAVTRFCRILGTMLANGVPMLTALKISKDATGSPLLAAQIAAAADSVRDGKSLSAPLAAGGLIPEQIVAMISVAEESNKLDQVLIQIADTVERRTDRQVDQAVRLVEPLILCVVAAAIGFLALGLLLPIFTLASSLGRN